MYSIYFKQLLFLGSNFDIHFTTMVNSISVYILNHACLHNSYDLDSVYLLI